MWREIRELGKTKPVIASMADVAASGGYYMVSSSGEGRQAGRKQPGAWGLAMVRT